MESWEGCSDDLRNQVHSHSHSLTLTLAHTLPNSLTLTHTHSRSLSLSPLTHALCPSLTHTLSLSQQPSSVRTGPAPRPSQNATTLETTFGQMAPPKNGHPLECYLDQVAFPEF